jgi:selenium-dependent xanthine dehydrogenase
MATITINGTQVQTTKNEKLIDFLRDTLHLTGVKAACRAGACGSCTVLIDGKPRRSCNITTDSVDGQEIVTCEGLSEREQQIYTYAFAEAGAVQCGFCTPGMVLAAKGLLDRNQDPSLDDIREAIKTNICRCTGYKTIEEAILLAAKLFREDAPIVGQDISGLLGDRLHRVDAAGKILGTSLFSDDIYLPGMLYGSALRSKYPRARVLSIDTSKAKALPGVVAVLTAEDIPGSVKIGYIRPDWDVMIPIGKTTHYLGDAIALVAAETKETVEEAKALIEVEYEVLPAIFSAQESKDGVVKVHDSFDNLMDENRLVRGDVDEAIKNSKYTVTTHYSTPWHEHAFMEPECCVVEPDGEDGLHIYSGDQGVYEPRRECAMMLGIPEEKIHVTAMLVGGAFGAKNDMLVQHHAALLAWVTKRPVKVGLTREESMQCHPKRPPYEIDFTSACDENGILTAIKIYVLRDNGAYSSAGIPVLQRSVVHGPGPYMCPNVDAHGQTFYTNNPPGGAFRGFGVPLTAFAGESNLNKLAKMVGISPFEIRYRNAARPGGVLCNGQIVSEDCALVECLDALREDYEANPEAGIACAFKNCGIGVGLKDVSYVRLVVKGGKVHIHSAAACLGQGLGTVEVQMVCETAGLKASQCEFHTPDTNEAPDAGMAIASRHTVFTGEAACDAARQLKKELDAAGGSLNALEGNEFLGVFDGITDPIGSPKKNPVSHVCYGYSAVLAILGDDDKVEKIITANDIGRAVNPISLEGQLHGGIAMAMGLALTEDMRVEGGLVTTRFATLGIPRADQIPDIDIRLIEKRVEGFAHGAKGCGEIAIIPLAPALQLAYFNRTGKFQTRIPLETPYRKRK